MPLTSHAVARVTHASIRHPHANRRAYSFASAQLSCGVKGSRRHGGVSAEWYLPEVAVQNMYRQSSAVAGFGKSTSSSLIVRRFASQMSVHRSKYAAVVVGGGPAGITVSRSIYRFLFLYTELTSPRLSVTFLNAMSSHYYGSTSISRLAV